ncbi:MAG: VOC family protein [Pseudomonadota bacterium]|uniref:VOC family protein n=1 Tax=Gallaecimonas pentaromativorans TaxID=584787 RepID=UPI00067EF700|nr:VOC family protein [Gallaecimonas pentaromativorans]MED5524025.1 VOC family protein [Pseudomonadota bacterium]
MSVKPIPDGYHSLTPYLVVNNANDAIAFYQRAFGAELMLRLDIPGTQQVAHAELKFGNSHLMLTEENPQWNSVSPTTLGGSPLSLMFYVPDVDAAFARALEAGAVEVMAVQNQFYGDRSGTLKDPFGHIWTLGTHVEDVGLEELGQRMAAMFSAS